MMGCRRAHLHSHVQSHLRMKVREIILKKNHGGYCRVPPPPFPVSYTNTDSTSRKLDYCGCW